jgi:RNA polymerase sigma-70 factor, ECF subfamily
MNIKENPQKSLQYRGFEKAYKDLALPLYKFLIKRSGGDVELVEEVSSRTFEAALKGWDKFGHRSSYFTWVCKIALNKLADYYRDRIHQNSHLVAPLLQQIGQIEDKALKPEERLALEQLRSSVRECLNLMPEETKKLIYLRYWEDMTIKKIAEAMGISERAAEGKLYRARVELKLIVVDKYPDLH